MAANYRQGKNKLKKCANKVPPIGKVEQERDGDRKRERKRERAMKVIK